MYTIFEALKYTNTLNKTKIIVFLDSKSAISYIEKTSISRDATMSITLNVLIKMHKSNKAVTLSNRFMNTRTLVETIRLIEWRRRWCIIT